MLIDPFSETLFSELAARYEKLEAPNQLYLLIDGAFVPGLHRSAPDHAKALLFSLIPGSSEDALDMSPFLTPYAPSSVKLLKRCDRWPMVSVIETPEPMEQLAERLAAWCVVEADGQRFNLRFPDTRRLPSIYSVLNQNQQNQFIGGAVRWSYISRDGNWTELQSGGSATGNACVGVLDERQFGLLVEDSAADEVLTRLRFAGHDVYRRASRSHSLVCSALAAARRVSLQGAPLIAWCESLWKNDQFLLPAEVIEMLVAWREKTGDA